MPLKDRIVRHYDELTPLYKEFWGAHLHHGYWNDGSETKEEAQEQLIKELIQRSGIKRSRTILDVGCGMGGSAISLSAAFGAHVTGVTISETQVKIGTALARLAGADVRLLLMDAKQLSIEGQFDLIWSVEAISHLNDRRRCFQSMASLLEHGGTLIVADWLRAPSVTPAQSRKLLEPIERSMLVPRLDEPAAYCTYIEDAGLAVRLFEDISRHVARTWDLAIDMLRNPALWKFAASRGGDFIQFLQGFKAMRDAYKSNALVYGVLIAEKP